jgi:hypothetical protein
MVQFYVTACAVDKFVLLSALLSLGLRAGHCVHIAECCLLQLQC